MLTHPLFLGAMEFDSPDDGAPLPELVDPVVQGGLGHDDHVGPMDAAVLVQVAQQGDCLQGLAQALQPGSSISASISLVSCGVINGQAVSWLRQAFNVGSHSRQTVPLFSLQSETGEAEAIQPVRERSSTCWSAYHLVSQDAIDAVVVEVDEPVEALHLVLAHDAVLDDAGLLAEAVPRALQAVLQQVSILHLLCVLGRVAPARLPAGPHAAL